MPASERGGSRLLPVVAVLAVAQGVLGALRALELVSLGTDVTGRGVLLLPLIGSLIIVRGVVVAAIAALYAVFAWGAFYRKAWAWPIGMLAALINGLLVVAILIGGDGARGTLLWAVVPVIILIYLLMPAGRRAFLTLALCVVVAGCATTEPGAGRTLRQLDTYLKECPARHGLTAGAAASLGPNRLG